MNILTIIILLILAVFALNGYRRGFIKTFSSLVFLIVSAVLVYFATPYIGDFLKEHTPLYPIVEEQCEEVFDSMWREASLTAREEADNVGKEISESIEDAGLLEQIAFIENLKLPKLLQEELVANNNKAEYQIMKVDSFSQYLAAYMATLIVNVIAFVVTLILVSTFLSMTVMTLDAVANLPIIHGVNQIFGLGLGAVQGLLIVWIIFLAITMFGSTEAGQQLLEMIYESPILNFLYNTNILLQYLLNFVTGFV